MVWYTFEVTSATTQPITITAGDVNCDNTGGGTLQMGVFYAGSATCADGLDAMSGRGCDVDTNTDVEVTLPVGQPNGTYYVVCDGNAGAQCRWNFTSDQILPVELAEFRGYNREDINVLEWKTDSELNNDYFEAQRAIDPSKEFEVIGTVKGNGTTADVNFYDFIDKNPLTSGYYKLKQIDFDGKYEYTNVIHIARKDTKFAISNLFPVPSKDKVTLKYEVTTATDLTLTITDMLGRLITTEEFVGVEGTQFKDLDISSYANGVYTLTISDGETKSMEKLIKN